MLIGINGVKESGKDTSFALIRDLLANSDTPVVRDAFADRLKVSAARALGFKGDTQECVDFCNYIKGNDMRVTVDRPYYDGTEVAEYFLDISGREFLQLYGTEAHRDVFGHDFWVQQVLSREPEPHVLLVVTDVRFDNEAEAVIHSGGIVWEVVRPQVESADSHASEKGLSPKLIHRQIDNSKGLDHLREQLRAGLQEDFGLLVD